MEGNAGRRITAAQSAIIVMLIVGASLLGYGVYGDLTASRGPHQMSVQTGDQVLVNYTGQYTNGLVFDTSIYSVAVNNVTYPKAPGFEWRGASQYKPLNVTSVGNGQLIKGFQDALIGMYVNQTKTVLIPPSQGYGPLNMSLMKYLPIYQNLTAVHQVPTALFEKEFSVVPQTGMVLRDPVWGWNDRVLSTGNGTTIYQYEPSEGQTVYPYSDNSTTVAGLSAWPVTVVAVNSGADNGSGQIEIRNEVTPQMVLTVGGVNQNGSEFTLWSINTNGTVTLDFNKPVVGRSLLFTITVLFIENPTTGKKAGTPQAATSAYTSSMLLTDAVQLNLDARSLALSPRL